MTAQACLRIVLELDEAKQARLDALGPMVSKVIHAFLETHWRWPKRFDDVGPFVFLLVDPERRQPDIEGLGRLANDLHLRLFGTQGAGQVTLLLFNGERRDAEAFMAMPSQDLREVAGGEVGGSPFQGHLMSVSAPAAPSEPMSWRYIDRDPVAAAEAAARRSRERGSAIYRGVYFTPTGIFTAAGISRGAGIASIVDGPDRLPPEHDLEYTLECLDAARTRLATAPRAGVLFVPVSYSVLARRSEREALQQALRGTDPAVRPFLGATIFHTPLAPGFGVFSEIQNILSPRFGVIDFRTQDPAFEIDRIPSGLINSVTLRLVDGDPRRRAAAAKRWMDRRAAFRRFKLWPGVTNVRDRADLEACLMARAPFVSGAAVSGPTHEPMIGLSWQARSLPLREAA